MTKEVFENLQRQIEDHLAAMPREKTRFPDKNVDMLQYVESKLKSLLTPPADVQERAKEYADGKVDLTVRGELITDIRNIHTDIHSALIEGYLAGNAGASSLQAENERLREALQSIAEYEKKGTEGMVIFLGRVAREALNTQ